MIAKLLRHNLSVERLIAGHNLSPGDAQKHSAVVQSSCVSDLPNTELQGLLEVAKSSAGHDCNAGLIHSEAGRLTLLFSNHGSCCRTTGHCNVCLILLKVRQTSPVLHQESYKNTDYGHRLHDDSSGNLMVNNKNSWALNTMTRHYSLDIQVEQRFQAEQRLAEVLICNEELNN